MDENALEAMLARQRNAERGHRPQGSVRTEKTAEFEVYERKDPEAGPAQPPQHPPRRAHAPLRAPAPRRDEGGSDFEELPGRQTPPAADTPALSAQPVPQPSEPSWQPPGVAPPETAPPASAPESVPQAAPQTVPQGPPAAAPQAPETLHEPVQETRRPQVWPPIQPKAPAAPADPAPPGAPAADPAPPAAHAPPDGPAPTVGEAAPARSHVPGAAGHAGASNGSGCRIAIVQALFNQEITQQMADAATAQAAQAGAEVRHHVEVPGVFDLPLTVQTLARRNDVDAVVAIGCVIQGETDHDDLITFTTAKTLQEISLATQTPVGLGIIGPGMTWEQAEARVGNGAHAVDAVIAQWRLLQTV